MVWVWGVQEKKFLAESDGRTIKEPCVWTKLGAAAPNTMIKHPQKLFFPCMVVFSEDKQSNLGKSDLSTAKQALTLRSD